MFAVPLAAAGCMLNFSGGWLQPGLIPVAWFFLVRGLLSTSVLGMYYVSHKAAVTEVFVLEKERVEMNTSLALSATVGFVVGTLFIGAPSMRKRADESATGQRADYLTFGIVLAMAWVVCVPWALYMRHTIMTKPDDESGGPFRTISRVLRSGRPIQAVLFA